MNANRKHLVAVDSTSTTGPATPPATLTPEPRIRSMRILRLPDVEDRVGLKRTQIYERIKRGQFPVQMTLSGGRAVGWFEHEIDAYLLACAAQRPAGWQDEKSGANEGAQQRQP